jgi:hypothetical protein
MELFDAAQIAETMAYLGIISGTGMPGGQHGGLPFSAANKQILLKRLRRAKKSCGLLGLKVSNDNCSDVVKLMRLEQTNREVSRMCLNLLETIRRELKVTKFFRLTAEDEKYLEAVDILFEKRTLKKFPSILDDIEEAGKCLAYQRPTACVFHLMRALEVTVKAIWKTLKLPPPKLPDNWGALIGPMDKELSLPKNTRNPLWVTNEAFFAEAVADLRAIKKAWRDTTMHVERTYSIEQAREIFAAIAALMKHLATRLDENGSLT